MLDSMRKGATKWVVQGFMVLLVASFALWGIGDVFFGGGANTTVATVGSSEITAAEVSDAFQESLNRLRQQLGTEIDQQQALRLGVLNQALEGLIARRLLTLGVSDLGLEVEDDTLRQQIVDNPAFASSGGFDRQRFEALLRANGFTEERYLAGLKQDTLRGALVQSLGANVEVPEILAQEIYRYRNQERSGEALVVITADVKNVPEPDDEQLGAYLEEHQDRFVAPEYRAIKAITLQPGDLLDEVAVDEDRVRSEYESRVSEFTTPERREVEQLLAPDEETMTRVVGRLDEGASFAEVAEEMADANVSVDSLGEVTRAQLPEQFAAAIFDLAPGQISEPVQSPFGWHLFRVDNVVAEAVEPFDAVSGAIREELALQEARDALPALRNALDDELAAGSSLEDAAATLNLEVTTIDAVDANGLDSEGQPVNGIPRWPELLNVAFESAPQETSLLNETADGGYFVLRVDNITESRPKTLDEVRDQVEQAWLAGQRDSQARTIAEGLLERARAGASLASLAEEEPAATVRAIEPIKRSDPGTTQGLGPAAVAAMFKTPGGEVVDEVEEVARGYGLVRVDEIIEPDIEQATSEIEAIKVELAQQMRGDLVAQYEAAMRQRYPVDINRDAMNRLF